jgi:hypothetical protein
LRDSRENKKPKFKRTIYDKLQGFRSVHVLVEVSGHVVPAEQVAPHVALPRGAVTAESAVVDAGAAVLPHVVPKRRSLPVNFLALGTDETFRIL